MFRYGRSALPRAVKVVRPSCATDKMLRRFEHESEVLGRLLHPGIAQIYEAGTADAGLGPQPFFAMELVKGVTLTRYANENRLSTRARLELMALVCDAVQHAHQKGVIHRDLKPGNIVVTGHAPRAIPNTACFASDRLPTVTAKGRRRRR